MSNTPAPTEQPQFTPMELLLAFIRSMRTSPRVSADEAVIWAQLEKEFQERLAK